MCSSLTALDILLGAILMTQEGKCRLDIFSISFIGCRKHMVYLCSRYIVGTPARSSRPGLNKLRTSRILEEGMVLTNEPGCYFVNFLLDTALANPAQAKYINAAVVDRFRGFGGVRIEDVVLVSSTGPVTLSTCPRTVNEVESVLNGGVWPPEVDEAPELKRKWAKLHGQGYGMEHVGIVKK
ncbi:M24 family metallopeptidase [archaeon]|nr:MAG: M24 family metallopeptidase [archaeon]